MSTRKMLMVTGKKLLANAVKGVPYLLILLPACCGFLYVYTFGVNVVAGDEWAVVPLFEKLYAGELSLSDLLAQHNEHRIFFPRIAMLSLGVITQWNVIAEMYLTEICFLVTLLIL